MTSQLSLIHHSDEPTRPADTSPAPAGGPDAPHPDTGPIRPHRWPRQASTVGRLDGRTIARGRRGVAEARAELQDAAGRAAERQRARMEERLARLEQFSRQQGSGAVGDDDPGTSHRAA